MKTMRAIKIDASTHTISEINIDANKPKIASQINCDWFCTGLNFPNYDILFVDDEGLLKPCDDFQFWRTDKGRLAIFAGSGLIVGGTPEGESKDAKTTIEWVENHIMFINALEATILAERHKL